MIAPINVYSRPDNRVYSTERTMRLRGERWTTAIAGREANR